MFKVVSDFISNKNVVKAVGAMATVLGVAATLVANWVSDQRMDEKIEERVNEAFNRKYEEYES